MKILIKLLVGAYCFLHILQIIPVHAVNVSTTQITSNNRPKFQAIIKGNRIVFLERSGGDNFIKLYDLGKKEETVLYYSPKSIEDINFNGKYVTWSEQRGKEKNSDKGWDVFLFNVEKKQLNQISNSSLRDRSPVIANENVFFFQFDQNGSKSALKSYHIPSGKETVIFENEEVFHPIITGHFFIYTNPISHALSLFDLTTKKKTIISAEKSLVQPSVFNDNVIWATRANDNNNYSLVKQYNIASQRTEELIPGLSYGKAYGYIDPSRYDHFLFYLCGNNYESYSLMLYDLDKKKEYKLVDNVNYYSYDNGKIAWISLGSGSELFVSVLENNVPAKAPPPVISSNVYKPQEPAKKPETLKQPEKTVTVEAPVIPKKKIFDDIEQSPAKEAIERLAEKGIVSGRQVDGKNLFFPNKLVTRAEFITMLVKALHIPGKKGESSFSDMQQHWSVPFIEAAVYARIATGHDDGRFFPEQPITKAEIAAFVVRAKKWRYIKSNVQFQDVPQSHWAYWDVQTAQKYGVLGHQQNNIFYPDRHSTRAEAATVIDYVIKKQRRNVREYSRQILQ